MPVVGIVFKLFGGALKLPFILFPWLAAMVVAPVFAAPFDLTSIDGTGDLSAIIAQAEADYVAAVSTGIYDGNVALITQTGDGMFTSIDQTGGIGNFVGIIQDASAYIPGIAYVYQAGNGNFALINLR